MTTRASLCHPDTSHSCGACCGIYNNSRSREDTLERLRERTLAFRRLTDQRDVRILKDFRAMWESPAKDRLMADLQDCPFTGLLDLKDDSHPQDSHGRIGCLVHPKQNDGFDGRDCGVFDRHICEDYLCASHSVLKSDEKWLLTHCPLDSYTYGLVITDPHFVRSILNLIASEIGQSAGMREFENPQFREALATLFAWKHTWPYRAFDASFGQLQAGEGLETPRRPMPNLAFGISPTPIDDILVCLGSEFHTLEDLLQARHAIQDAIREIAATLLKPHV